MDYIQLAARINKVLFDMGTQHRVDAVKAKTLVHMHSYSALPVDIWWFVSREENYMRADTFVKLFTTQLIEEMVNGGRSVK